MIAEVTGDIINRNIVDVSPDRIRLQNSGKALVQGRLAGAHVGTMTVLWKTDGTNVWETRIFESTKDGPVYIIGYGTGRQAGPGIASYTGEFTFLHTSPGIALKGLKAKVEGTESATTGKYSWKIYPAE